MFHKLKYNQFGWLVIALLSALVLGGLMPNTPLHAVATDRFETFAVATGPVDDEVEAIFFLNFLTGDLSAAVLSGKTGRFAAFYVHNVLNDLGIAPAKNPRYLMVTGEAKLPRGPAQLQPGRAVVYVAEITSGKVAAYAVPWNPAMKNLRQPVTQPLRLLDVTRFRNVPVVQPQR